MASSQASSASSCGHLPRRGRVLAFAARVARSLVVLTGLGAGLGTWRSAAAAEPPCPVDPAVTDASPRLARTSPDQRLAFITTQMDVGAKRSLGWAVGWGVAYATAAAAQFTISPFVERGTQLDLWVGGTSAVIGAITRTVSRPAIIRERRKLRRHLAGPGDRCERLAYAERALVASARWETRNRKWWMHVAALTYNVGVGLVLGLGFKRPLQGIRQATIGAAVGQIMFVTQPMLGARALDRYRAGQLAPPRLQVSSGPLFVRGGAGMSVYGRF